MIKDELKTGYQGKVDACGQLSINFHGRGLRGDLSHLVEALLFENEFWSCSFY